MSEEIRTGLECPELGQFTATEAYYRVTPFARDYVVTDGVKYVMACGYSWLITDALIAIAMKPKLRREEFLTVELKITSPHEARLIMTDGGKGQKPKVLYRQKYGYTDAKRELKFYVADKVMMLESEY